MHSEEEKRKRLKGYHVCFVLGILLVIMAFGTLIADAVGPEYEFRAEVRGHVENARHAQTPEQFIEELEQAKQGMIELNLTEDMYAKWFGWEHTPDTRMSWQYELLDNVTARAYAVIEWRDLVYAQNSTNEIYRDVYEDKMKSLRGSVGCGDIDCTNIDDVAHDAYKLHYHPFFYWTVLIFVLGFISGGVLVMAAVIWYGWSTW